MKTSIALTLALCLALPGALLQAQTNAIPTPSEGPDGYSESQAGYSEAQLDSLLAPIALYPDTLLSHVLIAATYPLEIVQADRWARAHPELSGEAAVNAVDDQNWDPSVKALVAFPELLARMSQDLDWTQQLGDAFLADEGRVMDHIQLLRNKAYAEGSLDRMDHVRVVREARIISIEPQVENIVYVPMYDTRVVYGDWWWAGYPPVYWYYPSNYVYISGFYWSSGIFLGSSFYYSGCHWRDRRVMVVDRDYRPSHYSNRTLVRYRDARPWTHNPVHRRGVAYADAPSRLRYQNPRYSNTSWDDRRQPGEYRHQDTDHQSSDYQRFKTNDAPDQRQGRLSGSPRQLQQTPDVDRSRRDRNNQNSQADVTHTTDASDWRQSPNRTDRNTTANWRDERSDYRTDTRINPRTNWTQDSNRATVPESAPRARESARAPQPVMSSRLNSGSNLPRSSQQPRATVQSTRDYTPPRAATPARPARAAVPAEARPIPQVRAQPRPEPRVNARIEAREKPSSERVSRIKRNDD